MQYKVKTNIDKEKELEKALKNALFDYMLKINEYAKRGAPVDTGRLRNSIHIYPKKPSNEIVVSDGVEYGIHQEYGTARMSAQPFMRPAIRKARLHLKPILKKHLK